VSTTESRRKRQNTTDFIRHYVAFIRKQLDLSEKPKWVLFNDEKVVEAGDVEEMKKTAYVYFFSRV
jgi:ubiquitin carboxyl-terminal hydrolase 5/13